MTYTAKQLELMNLWLLTIINIESIFNPIDTFARKHDISLELSNWTYNNMVKIGHELSILRGYKSPSDKWKIIKVDRIACENFLKNGGFIDHFQDKSGKSDKFSVTQNFHVDQSIKLENQSSLNMRDNISEAKIDKMQIKRTEGVENSAFQKSEKVFVFIIKYIIIPLLLAYLIYKFGWK